MAPTSITSRPVIENGLTTVTVDLELSKLSLFSPLERILLTANGNLQRIVSAYHATPVQVNVVYNVETQSPGIFLRQVTLSLRGSTPFCRATSKVIVTCPTMKEAIASNKIGIGQLFRHFDTLPVFTLRKAERGRVGDVEDVKQIIDRLLAEDDGLGRIHHVEAENVGAEVNKEDESFWRFYDLRAAGVTCFILEQFERNVLS
jgi:hypothetical protein